jgi:hypothetical protein
LNISPFFTLVTILTPLLDENVFRFWTLTANPDAYRHDAALELAKQKGLSPEGVSRLD